MGRCKEYQSTAYYSGPFTLGDMMTIRVKAGLLLRTLVHGLLHLAHRCGCSTHPPRYHHSKFDAIDTRTPS